VVVNVFLTFTTVVLSHFAEGSHIQTYNVTPRLPALISQP